MGSRKIHTGTLQSTLHFGAKAHCRARVEKKNCLACVIVNMGMIGVMQGPKVESHSLFKVTLI